MKKLIAVLSTIAAASLLTACSPANISSNLRAPSSNNLAMKTRCIDFQTGKEDKVNALLAKYDGWKIAYASEYTTENKATTSMVMCFEKPSE